MNENVDFALKLLKSPSQRKHALRWLLSLRNESFLKNKEPWLVYDAIGYLQHIDLAGRHVFEYGSGASTLYWISRGATCVSIEHDARWYERVQARLGRAPAVDYRLVEPKALLAMELANEADPRCYLSGDKLLRNYSFREYVMQIDQFPDCFFDLVLIDGRSRPACIMHSVNKVKFGGRVVIDNSDRDYYFSMTNRFLEGFELESKFVGPVAGHRVISATSFYLKRE